MRARDCPVRDIDRLAVLPSQLVDRWPLQPTAGHFQVVGDDLCFVPRFSPVPGVSYSLLIDGVEVGAADVPPQAGDAVTRVTAIYPTAPALPLNQLKLYIQFSGPMSEGWANRAVHVRRATDGQPLEGVFLPMEPALWDHHRRRLTLLLDPGRIKRGLAPNSEAGYPLVEGEAIVVAVDASFRDADGLPLRSGMQRGYAVGPAIRSRVEPRTWRCGRPRVDSVEPLTVEFDRPLDRALLEHSLSVIGPGGRRVDGRAAIADGEAAWSFAPRHAWRGQVYRLLVDARLEDLAGNSLVRVFDRDLMRPQDAPVDLQYGVVEFRPG
jgi:hypothetical protein